jgi:hypothetical protein
MTPHYLMNLLVTLPKMKHTIHNNDSGMVLPSPITGMSYSEALLAKDHGDLEYGLCIMPNSFAKIFQRIIML